MALPSIDMPLYKLLFRKSIFAYFEKPLPSPSKIPFRRGETVCEGVSGAKAELFGRK